MKDTLLPAIKAMVSMIIGSIKTVVVKRMEFRQNRRDEVWKDRRAHFQKMEEHAGAIREALVGYPGDHQWEEISKHLVAFDALKPLTSRFPDVLQASRDFVNSAGCLFANKGQLGSREENDSCRQELSEAYDRLIASIDKTLEL